MSQKMESELHTQVQWSVGFRGVENIPHKTCFLPSGIAPNVVFDMPGDYGLQNLAIPITPAVIEELRAMIETLREEAFRWVSDEFNVLATQVYEELGSLKMEALAGWAIYNAMAPLIRSQVDYEILM
ncbi:hypothetical protein C8R45DRAFT_1208692 [Mycena sanguinolenta]|nr:hypothetical protein C8R45DRAFT_1208692 [Mycena sanguinolenta]